MGLQTNLIEQAAYAILEALSYYTKYFDNSLNVLPFVFQDGGSKKKKKKKKDADAPKRPMSAYFLWLNENRERIKTENPGIGVAEVAKKGGEQWKEVADKTVSLIRCINENL